jgi:type IV pilus assembly protein PilV
LIEVLVALVVVSIGLLGLAKMESLAVSSADVSGNRAIAAMQAASMAAMMHADRDYWATANATASTTVQYTSGAVAVSDATLVVASGNTNCYNTGTGACAPLSLAATDLRAWGTVLNALLPGYLATITCTPTTLAASPPTPVTCTVQITWAEAGVQMDANQTNTLGLSAPTYTLNVQP